MTAATPVPDANNWDFRYNTSSARLSVSRREPGRHPAEMRVIGNAFLSDEPPAATPTPPGATTPSSAAPAAPTASPTDLPQQLYLATITGTYTLTPTSILRDKGNPTNYPSNDINGTPRYTGTAPDIGADESS